MRILILAAFIFTAFISNAQDQSTTTRINNPTPQFASEGIKWMTWEEAFEANKKEKRKVFVDVYTEWCGWCKKMDQTTFISPEVVKELNANFYAIKFDAEQKESIEFNDYKYVYVPGGRKGTHQLATSLLNGRNGYPSFVVLDENFNRIRISPGYKKPEQLMRELKYASTEAYKKHNFETWN